MVVSDSQLASSTEPPHEVLLPWTDPAHPLQPSAAGASPAPSARDFPRAHLCYAGAGGYASSFDGATAVRHINLGHARKTEPPCVPLKGQKAACLRFSLLARNIRRNDGSIHRPRPRPRAGHVDPACPHRTVRARWRCCPAPIRRPVAPHGFEVPPGARKPLEPWLGSRARDAVSLSAFHGRTTRCVTRPTTPRRSWLDLHARTARGFA